MRSPRPAPGRKHRARPIVPLQRGDEPEHRAAEAKGYQKKEREGRWKKSGSAAIVTAATEALQVGSPI